MEVDEIARKLELGELALPALQVLCASHPAVQQKRRIVELPPGMDEGPMRGNLGAARDQVRNDLLFLCTDMAPGAELLKMLYDRRRHPEATFSRSLISRILIEVRN